MEQKFSNELEQHLVIRYASLRHKFQASLQDQNEHKNLPNLSFTLLSMLKNVQHAKPHAEYAIETLENTDLKLRAINCLIKGQMEQKTKETAKLSLKTTLNADEYFKEKLEKMKEKEKEKAPVAIKKPAPFGNEVPSEGVEVSSSTRNKPLVRNFQTMEEEGRQEFQMVNKKPKVNQEERNNEFMFQTTNYGNQNQNQNAKKPFGNMGGTGNMGNLGNMEEKTVQPGGEMPGFMTAKDQFIKNQQQKKGYNSDHGDEYGGQYKKGGYNNYNKYSKYGNEEGYDGGYKGYGGAAKQQYFQNKKNGNNKYGWGNQMEEEGDYGNMQGNRYGNNRGAQGDFNPMGRNKANDGGDTSLVEKVHMSVFKKNLTADVGGSSMRGQTGGNEEGSSLGQTKNTGLRKKFIPPLKENAGGSSLGKQNSNENNEKVQDERYKGLDPKLVEMIENEIVDRTAKIGWKDIAGLQFAKKTIYEIIVWPMMRPDIFNGLRAPPKGLLLFGPPGTGKTMIGKAIASESNSTFFSISASSLTSKWVGEGEKMVKTLFSIAAIRQPSVIFIDEIDSLLCARSEKDEESSRRIKTEFLVQLDGARSTGEERILIIGATNRPQELDEAVRRRFQKRLYIPLPNSEARRELIKTTIEEDSKKGNKYSINEEELMKIIDLTKGYSGADMRNLCAEAAMIPLRNINDIAQVDSDNLRATCAQDFMEALKYVKASVSNRDLGAYLEWNRSFGSFDFKEEDLEN